MIWVCAGLGAVAALALAFGALCWGMYVGERGRRRSAESYLVFGSPEAQPAKSVYPHALPAPVEPVNAPKGFDPGSIKRGAQQIMAESAAAGAPLGEREATEMAESLLTAAFADGGDLAIP